MVRKGKTKVFRGTFGSQSDVQALRSWTLEEGPPASTSQPPGYKAIRNDGI